jgi:histidinol-phosphate/aromatic aminotransferase/cobyric acid decarboxylase-like protein
MRFPLADWIDAHADCRYDLASSGMRGSVPPPPWPARRPSRDVEGELRRELANHLEVDPERLFLAHGASEANAWVLGYLARELGRAGRSPVLRVQYPEYPPLFDTARAHGFVVRRDRGPAAVAAVSRPRNPEGDLWSDAEVARFADGAGHLLVDETFREFTESRSVAAAGTPRLWATGSFTKFYGADEARVGFAVTPPEVPERFVRYVGLVSDELAPGSAAMALGLLRRFASVRRSVRRVVDRNLRALAAAVPATRLPAAPLYFDRLGQGTGRRLAERCLSASVLVCPGAYFGEPRGVRICLTRRNFPEALRVYLGVRGAPAGTASGRGARV